MLDTDIRIWFMFFWWIRSVVVFSFISAILNHLSRCNIQCCIQEVTFETNTRHIWSDFSFSPLPLRSSFFPTPSSPFRSSTRHSKCIERISLAVIMIAIWLSRKFVAKIRWIVVCTSITISQISKRSISRFNISWCFRLADSVELAEYYFTGKCCVDSTNNNTINNRFNTTNFKYEKS